MLTLIATLICLSDAPRTEAERLSDVLSLEAAKYSLTPADSEEEWFADLVPVHRYEDVDRGIAAGAIFRFGDGDGRPPAILSLEVTPGTGRQRCYVELLRTDDRETTVSKDDFKLWQPDGSQDPGLHWDVVEDSADQTADEVAQRFSGDEITRRSKTPMRVGDAIFRWSGEDGEGAIYPMVVGTNPRLVLAIEKTAEGWKAGPGRLSGSNVVVRLDAATFWESDRTDWGRSSGSLAENYPINVPDE